MTQLLRTILHLFQKRKSRKSALCLHQVVMNPENFQIYAGITCNFRLTHSLAETSFRRECVGALKWSRVFTQAENSHFKLKNMLFNLEYGYYCAILNLMGQLLESNVIFCLCEVFVSFQMRFHCLKIEVTQGTGQDKTKKNIQLILCLWNWPTSDAAAFPAAENSIDGVFKFPPRNLNVT